MTKNLGYKPRRFRTALCYNIQILKGSLGSRHVETATMRANLETAKRAMVNSNPEAE